MRKVIIGAAAVGAVVGLGIVGRRIDHKMREHCGQMAAQCKQMMAEQVGNRSETTEARERCGQRHAQAAETHEHSDQDAPQFVGRGKAVGAA